MARSDRMIARALDASRLSYGVRRAAIGAVVANGNRVLAVAANYARNIPSNAPDGMRSWHAEVAAIKMCDPRGATLYVARRMADGTAGMARPCVVCFPVIRETGILRVIYTDWDGVITQERINW